MDPTIANKRKKEKKVVPFIDALIFLWLVAQTCGNKTHVVTSCLNNILSLCLQFTSAHHSTMVCQHIKASNATNLVLSASFSIRSMFYNFYRNIFPQKKRERIKLGKVTYTKTCIMNTLFSLHLNRQSLIC